MALSSCSENEIHVVELRLLREKLAAAEKKAAEAVAVAQQTPAPAVADTKPDTETAAKLAAAVTKIASLEQELQKARSATLAAAENGAAKGKADSFREFVKTMELDLLTKAGELQQSVEQALPTANIQETTVKRLRLPEDIATAFQSAVVFNIANANGQTRRLEFPVQAGLDGQWRLPGAADVQHHIAAVAAQPQAAPQVAATPTPSAPANAHAPTPLPTPTPGNIPHPSGAPTSAGGTDTFVIQWGNAASNKTPTPPAPAPQPVATASAAPAAAKPAPAPRPSVPKPLMPVQQDVQIRFE